MLKERISADGLFVSGPRQVGSSRCSDGLVFSRNRAVIECRCLCSMLKFGQKWRIAFGTPALALIPCAFPPNLSVMSPLPLIGELQTFANVFWSTSLFKDCSRDQLSVKMVS